MLLSRDLSRRQARFSHSYSEKVIATAAQLDSITVQSLSLNYFFQEGGLEVGGILI